VLQGKVLSLEAVPLLFDTATGRATTMLVTLKCEISFERARDGKDSLSHGQFYFPQPVRNFHGVNNANSIKNFFEEQDPALDRMAQQDFGGAAGAAVVENY